MIQNFRAKCAKDVETADESLLISSFRCKIPEAINTIPKLTVTYQQDDVEPPDDLLERKK